MRALADYAAELGRARPRKLAPATIGRKLAAVRAFLRHALGAERVPDASFAPRRPRRLPDAPRPSEVDVELDALEGDDAARDPQPRARRARLLGRPALAGGCRPRPGRRRLRAGARPRPRQGRQGARRPARRGGLAPARALPPGRAPAAGPRRRERALPLSARPPARHEHAPPAPPPPASPAARLRDPPARGRGRPPHDPGAARPQLAVDDADVQPRRREASPQGVRQGASAVLTRFTLCDIFIT